MDICLLFQDFAVLPIFALLANKIYCQAWKIPLIQDNQFYMGLKQIQESIEIYNGRVLILFTCTEAGRVSRGSAPIWGEKKNWN